MSDTNTSKTAGRIIEAPPGTTCTINGREYAVTEYVKHGGAVVPVVDIPQMSDYRWQELALKSRIEHPELYREMGVDVDAEIARIKKQLAEWDFGEAKTA